MKINWAEQYLKILAEYDPTTFKGHFLYFFYSLLKWPFPFLETLHSHKIRNKWTRKEEMRVEATRGSLLSIIYQRIWEPRLDELWQWLWWQKGVPRAKSTSRALWILIPPAVLYRIESIKANWYRKPECMFPVSSLNPEVLLHATIPWWNKQYIVPSGG